MAEEAKMETDAEAPPAAAAAPPADGEQAAEPEAAEAAEPAADTPMADTDAPAAADAAADAASEGGSGGGAVEDKDDIMALLEEDDFEDFLDEKWGQEGMDLEDASGMWIDSWAVPVDAVTLKLKETLGGGAKPAEKDDSAPKAEAPEKE
eukprot:TRINITY_DN36843_c0_g1_i1.p1 TRINITY_DN36843_c0_g1~~TRINITY_DN36843_c0_g1_i1.p1  ORF type:complete len:150 (+),score=64.34 TRINITY_DN36843_c0_g1_i1:62-511(+)